MHEYVVTYCSSNVNCWHGVIDDGKWTTSRQDKSTEDTQLKKQKTTNRREYYAQYTKYTSFIVETLNQGKTTGEQIFTIIVGVQEKENILQPLHNRVFPLGLKH